MLECFNEKCDANKDNKCTDKLMNLPTKLVGCPIRLTCTSMKCVKTKTLTQEAIENAKKETANNIKKIFDESLKLKEEAEKAKNEENIKLDHGIKLLQSENDEYVEALEKVRLEKRRLEEELEKVKKQDAEYFIQWGEAESKVKKQEREIEELKEENKLVKDQLENELNRNRVLKEKLEEKPTAINNYEDEINKLRCQYEEAKYYIEKLEKQAKENKDKLENYNLLKRMIKVLIEGL